MRGWKWSWILSIPVILWCGGCGEVPTISDNEGVSVRGADKTVPSDTAGASLAATEQKKRDCLKFRAEQGVLSSSHVHQAGAPANEPIPPGAMLPPSPCDPGKTGAPPIVPGNEPIPPCVEKVGCVPPVVQTPPLVGPGKAPCPPGSAKIGKLWRGGLGKSGGHGGGHGCWSGGLNSQTGP